MTTQTERRKKLRVPASFDLRLDVSGRAGSAKVRDISASGVRCVTDRAMPLMTQVAVTLLIPAVAGAREISCRGAVVRSAPEGRPASFETAIFFTHMSDADRASVEDFVSSAGRPR
jgi:hypothetical protein